ncbi:MAG: U32 family peptidase [Desulfobulbaceae bacterium]|nr:U32 family peptidase [Desulfobulbaceae bacterium]
MKRNIELLAPGGDIDSIKAAIAAGADAIYCGLNRFNARNRAANIILEDLNGILRLAHANNCKIFLTLNIVVVESEIPAFVRLLNKLINTSIDGVIVQDLGMLYLLSNYFSGLEIHASTQLTTHNAGQIKFLSKLNVSRVNLSRELSIDEVKDLTTICHENNILTEVFVQGSYCISFSGLCYMSSVFAGKSGNRGRCSQPCRDRYVTTPEGKNFPLNLKDNSAYFAFDELVKAQVDSIKIEGRIKASDYVYTVVNCWKKQIDNFCNNGRMAGDNSDLFKVFNRGFSDGFLRGNISKDIFIDNPMDNSIKQFAGINKKSKNKELLKEKEEYYGNKEKISNIVKNKIEQLSFAKAPLEINISGQLDAPLKVTVKSPDGSFVVLSTMNLVAAGTYIPNQHSQNKREVEASIENGNDRLPLENGQRKAEHLSYENFFERLKTINITEYYIDHLDLQNLQRGLFLPFKELTLIKKKIVSNLNGSREFVDPIDVPIMERINATTTKPTLAVLISSTKDLDLCTKTSADIFYQLPNSFGSQCREYVDLFLAHKDLIPWFPSILIGENYTAAVEFLQNVQPKLIVTNNTGIAYEAFSKGIPWIAGPYLNIVNSFSILCLKEKFNCCGSFLSNEINEYQLKNIRTPEGFKLYYSIYHPILLITSRQCLFHQVVGCEKDSIDEECIQKCSKCSSITRINEVPLFIEKTKGNYHSVYNNSNFLNTNVISDMPDKFSDFLVDLRDVKTETEINLDKGKIITLFENLLNADLDSAKELQKRIIPTTQAQYTKGI